MRTAKKAIKKAAKKTGKPSAKKAPKKETAKFKSDPQHTAGLIKAGHAASSNAIRESKALGLNITYLEKGVLYRESADGSKAVICPAKKINKRKTGIIILKKGLVLHAKK